MLSALGNGVKGGVWYSLMDKVYAPATLAAAWTKVSQRRRGGRGQAEYRTVRGERRSLFDGAVARAADGEYRPWRSGAWRSRRGWRVRPLGIPTVKDRIAETASNSCWSRSWSACPSGELRLPAGARAKDALREVDRLVESGHCFVVDADLESSSTRCRTTS